MFQRIREFVTPPKFDDDDKNLAARLLYAIIAVIVAVTFLLTFPLAFMLPSGNLSIAVQGGLALGISALIYFLIRRGAVQQASVLFLGLFFLINISAVVSGGGIRSNSFTNFMLLIFASGLLLGARAGFLVTALSAVEGLALVKRIVGFHGGSMWLRAKWGRARYFISRFQMTAVRISSKLFDMAINLMYSQKCGWPVI